MAKEASARHLLVDTEEKCLNLKRLIEAEGATIDLLARVHSKCPSGSKGGHLGTFKPGQMVKEFNDIVFNEEVGVVHGPVKTQFGYHLIEIIRRDD